MMPSKYAIKVLPDGTVYRMMKPEFADAEVSKLVIEALRAAAAKEASDISEQFLVRNNENEEREHEAR